MREMLLPYFEERGTTVDMLVLHSSAYVADELLKWLDFYKCSCHYILDFDGTLIKVVDESKAAQHAGRGFWRGEERSFNARSIGIEICSPTLGQEAFAACQIEKLIPFCQKLIRKYQIPAVNVVGHSDIAPQRKADPGKAFPWKQLAREGIGLWYQPKNAAKVAEKQVKNLLAIIGYDARGDDAVRASAYAFCRRFAPQFVKTDLDIAHLVEHVLPENFDFMADEKFLQILRAVAYSYK